MNLRYKGKPLNDSQTLRVAINNYRYSGGGGYDFAGLPIVYRSTEEIRDLIIEYLTRTAVVPTSANKNWHIEPQEAVEALERAAMKQEADAAFFEPKKRSGHLPFELPVALRVMNGVWFPSLQ